MTQLLPAAGVEPHSSTTTHAPAAELAERGTLRCLDLNDVLYRAGEPRSEVYEVTSGVICLYRERPDQPPRIVDLVHPGGVLGRGLLHKHAHTARAVVPTTLRVVPPGDAAHDNDALAQAARREFIARREAIVAGIPGDPLRRLARFLLAVSALDAREGRDAAVISDDLECGVVAEWLQMDVACLSAQLLELKRRGLVAPTEDGGLALLDLPRIADLG
jgi:CRP/FNR family transcriptional regulator